MIKKLQSWRDIIRRKIGIVLFDRSLRSSSNEDGAIVFVRWDAKLGDAIVSSWVTREIKKKFPGKKVVAITTPEMRSLFKNQFLFDEVYSIPKRPSYAALASLARDIGDIEYLVHLTNEMKMKDIFFISKLSVKNVIGIDDKIKCVNIKIGHLTKNIHFSQKFALAVNKMGVDNPDTDYIVPEYLEDESSVKSSWPDNPTICFNPYGSGSSRTFNDEKIIEILKVMLSKPGYNVCLLYPPIKKIETEHNIRRMPDILRERVITHDSSHSLGVLFAQIRNSIGIVSVDTATVHIAAGLKKPIFGIYNDNFGKGENREWLPNFEKAMVMYVDAKKEQNVNYINMEEFENQFNDWYVQYIAQ
ncbi:MULTISPECIES: glycosyltransferase family 9 protein [unclassified Aeromonas]|uniref:glycosyltransferase family 9 protein n=1 Tax=unclassified Aeromonas TaxID=257493 RepID=UPI003A249AFD